MFQFTHPCGCDQNGRRALRAVPRFNSRTRVGATSKYTGACHEYAVSIHAPVWVRLHRGTTLRNNRKFQFTHPCGCDVRLWLISRFLYGFNSRTRVGATFARCTAKRWQLVSIHAPVWVRLNFDVNELTQGQFQFTHPCGCDGHSILRRGRGNRFNSRTRVGATAVRAGRKYVEGVSIHAPVWVRRPDEYGLSIKHATKVLRQPDARTRCGQA